MSHQTQVNIQSTAGAVPVRNDKGNFNNKIFNLIKIISFHFHLFVSQVKYRCKR